MKNFFTIEGAVRESYERVTIPETLKDKTEEDEKYRR